MFHDLSDFNAPPCCSHKYMDHLFAHLKSHPNTTIFLLPDFPLTKLIERLISHTSVCELTIAIPRPSTDLVRLLRTNLLRPRTIMDNGTPIPTHEITTLNLIIAPPRLKEDPKTRISTLDLKPRRSLKEAFRSLDTRVCIFENEIATTIIHAKNATKEYVFYGDIVQETSTTSTSLRLLHASTDPLIIDEITKVLRMYSPKRKKV